jgi:hypothetical protein
MRSHRSTPRCGAGSTALGGRRCGDVVAAALVAGVLSGVPSTVWALRTGEDPLASSRAAGSLLLGPRRPGLLRLAAAVPVHAALSFGWAAVLARVLPRRHETAWGAVGGAAIAALDLGLVGRRVPAIAALPQVPQWADHVAFGAAVGATLRARRR